MAHPAIVRREEDTAVVDDDDLSSCISSESEIIFLFFSFLSFLLFFLSLSLRLAVSLSLCLPNETSVIFFFAITVTVCWLTVYIFWGGQYEHTHSHWFTNSIMVTYPHCWLASLHSTLKDNIHLCAVVVFLELSVVVVLVLDVVERKMWKQ